MPTPTFSAPSRSAPAAPGTPPRPQSKSAMVVMTRHELAEHRARFRQRLATIRLQRRIAVNAAVIAWLLLGVLLHARWGPAPQCSVSQTLAEVKR